MLEDWLAQEGSDLRRVFVGSHATNALSESLEPSMFEQRITARFTVRCDVQDAHARSLCEVPHLVRRATGGSSRSRRRWGLPWNGYAIFPLPKTSGVGLVRMDVNP
jgi:hypothetical protein